jgi:hypothetical protein
MARATPTRMPIAVGGARAVEWCRLWLVVGVVGIATNFKPYGSATVS